MTPHPPPENLSTAGGLAAIVLWSTTIAVARSLSEQLGPVTAAASVYLFGGIFCLVRLWKSGHGMRQYWELTPQYLFGCGFLFILYTVLLYLAVGLARDRAQVLEVGLINYLWPASTILFSLVLLRHRAGLLLVPGTLLALAGVFLVMTQAAEVSLAAFMSHVRSNPLAFTLAFIAAISWALYSNLTCRWASGGNGGAVELFILATGLVLLGWRLVSPEPTHYTLTAATEALALGAITALAYALWDQAMRKGDLLLVAACSYFTPLLSTLVSCAYLKVMPGAKLWLGCALLVLGSLVSWRSVTSVRTALDKNRFSP